MRPEKPAMLAIELDGEDKGESEGGEDTGGSRVDACQRVLDAIKADDAQALDSALGEWCDLYDTEE